MAKRRRWRKIGRALLKLFGVALVGAVGAGWYVYDYPRVAADLPEAVLAYRDADLPWTAKDIAPNPPVKPDENAAPLLRAALDAWPRREWERDGEKRKGYDDGFLDAAMYGEPVAPLLIPLGRSLALAHEAAGKPRLDFGRDWDLGPSLNFPEESRVKTLTKAFTARAALRCQKGDDTGALADLEDAQRLGALIGQESSIISALVGVACDRIATAEALRCLGRAAAQPARLVLYRDWLARPRPLFDLHRAFRGEIYRTIATMRNLDRMQIGTSWNFMRDQYVFMGDGPDEGVDWTLAPKTVRRDGYSDYQRPRAYLARALRQWTKLAGQTHGLKDPMESIAASATMIEAEGGLHVPTLSEVYDTITFPVFTQFGRSNHRVQASRTLALLYADALIQHALTGTWPTSSTVPDPLGEGTFNVRTDPDGRFRIWSVGENGVDNGGIAPTELTNSRRSSDDLVAAYPPIPKRYEKRSPPSKGPPPGLRGD